jgi:hypothetical protein
VISEIVFLVLARPEPTRLEKIYILTTLQALDIG